MNLILKIKNVISTTTNCNGRLYDVKRSNIFNCTHDGHIKCKVYIYNYLLRNIC